MKDEQRASLHQPINQSQYKKTTHKGLGVEFWGWLFIIALLGTSFALVVRMFLRDYGIWESLLYSFACFGLIAILAVFKAVTKNW